MSITITKFLRNTLYADMLFSVGGALIMAGGAPLLEPLLGVPSSLLIAAGLILIPWVIALFLIARRDHASRLVLLDVIGINVIWGAACLGLMISGWFVPTSLGVAFLVAQALAVLLFAALEYSGLQQARTAGLSQTSAI